MASKVLRKINAKLKFLYRQSRYLTPVYRRLLCNALIQPHFNYGCFSWFPRFCQNIPPRSHIDPLHFRKTNWLPVSDRVDYCIANTAFKYWNGIVPRYVHEMFKPSLCRCSFRSQMTLDIPPPKKNYRAKKLIFLGPKYMVQIRH